jgi:hypothetical protein
MVRPREANVNEILLSLKGTIYRATGASWYPQGRAAAVHGQGHCRCDRNQRVLSKELGIRKGDPMLRKVALFAHYKGAPATRARTARRLCSQPRERRLVLVHPAADDHQHRRDRCRTNYHSESIGGGIANCAGPSADDQRA